MHRQSFKNGAKGDLKHKRRDQEKNSEISAGKKSRKKNFCNLFQKNGKKAVLVQHNHQEFRFGRENGFEFFALHFCKARKEHAGP